MNLGQDSRHIEKTGKVPKLFPLCVHRSPMGKLCTLSGPFLRPGVFIWRSTLSHAFADISLP